MLPQTHAFFALKSYKDLENKEYLILGSILPDISNMRDGVFTWKETHSEDFCDYIENLSDEHHALAYGWRSHVYLDELLHKRNKDSLSNKLNNPVLTKLEESLFGKKREKVAHIRNTINEIKIELSASKILGIGKLVAKTPSKVDRTWIALDLANFFDKGTHETNKTVNRYLRIVKLLSYASLVSYLLPIPDYRKIL